MVERNFEGIKNLQKQLSEIIGISGYEKPVVDFIQGQIEELVDKMWIDPLGSLLAIIEGEKGEDRIMIDGHVDEIGFMVSYIDTKGYLRFVPIGGWDSRTLLGQSVKILANDNKEFHGIIGSKPPHLTTESERKNAVKISDMYIDTGMSTKDEVESRGIHIGSVGTLYDPFAEFPNNMVRGKAFDDRTAVNVLIHLIKEFSSKTPSDTLLFSFSTQEEVGGRGAGAAAFTLKPTNYTFKANILKPMVLQSKGEERETIVMKATQLPLIINNATTGHKLQGTGLTTCSSIHGDM